MKKGSVNFRQAREQETKTTAVKVNVYHLGRPVGRKGQLEWPCTKTSVLKSAFVIALLCLETIRLKERQDWNQLKLGLPPVLTVTVKNHRFCFC